MQAMTFAGVHAHNPTTGQKRHASPLPRNAICHFSRFKKAVKVQNAFGDICNQLDSCSIFSALSDTYQWNAFDDYDDELFEIDEMSHRHMTPIAYNSQQRENNQASSTDFHLCSGLFDVRKYKKWVGEKTLHVD
jgi:hypothetical protein